MKKNISILLLAVLMTPSSTMVTALAANKSVSNDRTLQKESTLHFVL